MTFPKVTAVLITREESYPRDIAINYPFEQVLIKTHCANVNDRYEMALSARNDLIYFQDDDAEINSRELWKHYNGRITCAMTPYHLNYYKGTGMTLVGWGAFFPKSMIDFTLWTKTYGPLPPQEADRVFTFLNQPHNPIVMPIRKVERPVALWKRPEHGAVLRSVKDLLHRLPVKIQC